MSRRCIAGLLTGAALGAEAARISRKGASSFVASKEVAGVPLLNYNLAYGGRAAHKHEKEHWIVLAKEGVSTATLEELCASAKGCEAVGHPSEGGIPFFEIYSTEQELEHVLALAPGQIEYVEPDGTFHLDPEESVEGASSSLWGLKRVGEPANSGSGANIYVFDTGVRWTHEDFGSRASGALDMSGSMIITRRRVCQGEKDCAHDVQGHGTHCAGTAGGSEYGVAKDATIYSVKVLGDSGGGSWGWTMDALDWVSTEGTTKRIASMSLGGSGTQSSMRDAVNKAVDRGVTVVVAAGNSNADACTFSPAFVPSAVTVGSTDSRDQRSGFSNFGSCVEIWAPGSDITSAGHKDNTAEATMSGTSMACPHVSGGAALVLNSDPSLKPEEVLRNLIAQAERGAIKGLLDGDSNRLLQVSEL